MSISASFFGSINDTSLTLLRGRGVQGSCSKPSPILEIFPPKHLWNLFTALQLTSATPTFAFAQGCP